MTSWLNLFLIACRTSSYPLFRTSSQKNPIILKISRVESSAQKSCLISWNHNFLHNQLNYINWMFKIFRWRLNPFRHRVKTRTFQRKMVLSPEEEEMLNNSCVQCDQGFKMGQDMLTYMGSYYHPNCFVCEQCFRYVSKFENVFPSKFEND